jgi:uncharacterized protein
MARGDTVIVFVRQPALGRVKRRLAAEVGAVEARRVYDRLTRAILGRVAGAPTWRTVLAVTPDRAVWRGWPRNLKRWDQGTGDLGVRMGRALRRLAGRRTVLIGSDIPGITRPAITRAFRALGQARFVFGPALDGGYWLIGWRRGAWPHGALTGVRWSSAHALADSRATLPAATRVALVDRLADLDDGPAYRAWRVAARSQD